MSHPTFGDVVTFVFDGTKFSIHQSILEERLPYFNARQKFDTKTDLFGASFDRNDDQCIAAMNKEEFAALIDWAYVNKLEPLLSANKSLAYWNRTATVLCLSELQQFLTRSIWKERVVSSVQAVVISFWIIGYTFMSILLYLKSGWTAIATAPWMAALGQVPQNLIVFGLALTAVIELISKILNVSYWPLSYLVSSGVLIGAARENSVLFTKNMTTIGMDLLNDLFVGNVTEKQPITPDERRYKLLANEFNTAMFYEMLGKLAETVMLFSRVLLAPILLLDAVLEEVVAAAMTVFEIPRLPGVARFILDAATTQYEPVDPYLAFNKLYDLIGNTSCQYYKMTPNKTRK